MLHGVIAFHLVDQFCNLFVREVTCGMPRSIALLQVVEEVVVVVTEKVAGNKHFVFRFQCLIEHLPERFYRKGEFRTVE